MGGSPNIGVAKDAVETFNRGDLDAYLGYFADDVVWHVGGHHALSGDYRGKADLLDYFRRVQGLTGGSLRTTPDAYLADDAHLGIFSRVTAARAGKSLDVVLAQAFRVDGDGRWSEYWAFADDQPAVDAFWSDGTVAAATTWDRPAPEPAAQPAPDGTDGAGGDMTRHPNALAARAAYEALNRREFAALAELLADDAVAYTSVSALPTTMGRDEFLGMINLADQISGGTQHVEMETVLATDDYLLAFMRGTAQRPGKSQDVVFVIGSKLNAVGQWQQMWYGTNDIAAVTAFWSD